MAIKIEDWQEYLEAMARLEVAINITAIHTRECSRAVNDTAKHVNNTVALTAKHLKYLAGESALLNALTTKSMI